MKLKKLLSLLLAVTMLFSCVGITAMAEDAEDVVFPNGMSASNYEELFGDNTVTDGESYWKTLEAATNAICGTENAVLYCKPDADVGKMTHGPVTATLTVYGNGAYTSGNGDFDIGNGDPNGGKDVTADMTLTVKNLNGCGAWGTKATDHTVNLVFENCKDMSEVYLSGTPGILNISITDCEFTDNVDGGNCKVYSNANGEITLTNVLFSRVDKAVNLNHKVAGTQTVTINNCTFTNCGKNVDAGTDEIPVRILSSVEGGESVATITNCSFSGTPEGGADILIDYGVGTTTATISGTAANVSEEKENNLPEKKTVTETETYVASNVEVEAPAVAEINGTPYATLADALAAAKSMTGDVVVKIYDKVTLSQPFSGSYDSIKFVGKEEDAEIYLDFQGYIDATGENVAFEALKLSKVAGGFVDNAGFMNLAFGINSAEAVTYTNCTFLNGAYASKGTNTFTNCTFYRSHDRYGLWAYGAETIVVDGCTFADIRGIKLWAEGDFKTTDLTVKNTDFSAVTDKPAIVLASGKSVALENNTYSSKGVFELDLDHVPNGTPVTSDKPEEITCVNDNGECGVLVDGKIYTTVAQAAEVATEGSEVTLLHNSAETVEFDEGVILDKNDFTAAGVTVKSSGVAEMNGVLYASVAEALDAAYNAEMKDVVITLVGETKADTTDSIDLYNKYGNGTAFNTITFRQADSSKAYYLYKLYTGWTGEKVVFDGVNIVVTGQLYAIGKVELTNNSKITRTNDVKNFIIYGDMYIQPGSKFISQVDGISSGSSLTIDGGRTDGTINTTADYKTVWLTVEADNTMTLKNGAYVVASNYEFTDLTLNGTVNMPDSRLDVFTSIKIGANGVLKLNANSVVKTGKIIGSGKIAIDGTDMTEGAIKALEKVDVSGFTGEIMLANADGYKTAIENGKLVLLKSAESVAEINGVGYATLEDALENAQPGDEITLLCDVETTDIIFIGKSVTINGGGHTITSSANRVIRVTTGNIDVVINKLNLVSKAVRTGQNEIRGISLDGNLSGVKLTLNNCSVDFTDASAHDWAYAVNITANNTNAVLTINGGSYEGANVINIYSGSNNTINVDGATLTSLYQANDMYYGLCIKDYLGTNTNITVKNTTFASAEGGHSKAIEIANGSVAEENNTDNTTLYVAKVGGNFYYSIEDAIAAANEGDTITIIAKELTFAENASSIIIDNAVTIAGNGKDKTKLNFNSATSAFVIKSSNVTFKDMTIKQGAKDNSFHISVDKGAWDAPKVQYSDITIKNIEFVGSDYALCLIGEDVVVDSCTFTNQDSHNIIVYSLRGNSEITNNVFNKSASNNKSAILYEGGADNATDLSGFIGGGNLAISGNKAYEKGVFFQFTSWKLVKDMNVAITDNYVDAFTNKAIAIYNMDGALEAAGDEFASFKVNDNAFVNVPAGRPIVKEYTGTVDVDASGNYLGSADPAYKELLVGDKVSVEDYYTAYSLTDGVLALENLVEVASPVAMVNGTSYATLTDAFNAVADGGEIVILASVAVEEETTLAKSVTISGEALNANGKLTIADGVTLNSANLTGTYYAAAGATVTVNTPQATLYAGGNLTFVGANVLSSFSAGYYNRVITIDAGNSLKVTSGRLTVSYGNTFNIKGNITDAKTTDKTGIIPSLELVGGISLNGDGGNVSFNIDNAYVKLGDSTSKNSGATGEFNINFTNSIVDFTKTLKTYNPTVDGLNPGFNLNWKDSVVSIYSHLELWRSSTNLTLDNTELIVGGSFANAGKVDVTKKSSFVVEAPIMSSHGGNTGTITIDGAKMEFVDSNEDWQNNGTIKITADGKLITNDFAFNNAIIVDAAKLEAGTSATVIEYHDDAPVEITLENGDNVDVVCENGSVIIEKKQLPVAQIGETPYTSLEDAIAAANEGDTITLINDIALTETVIVPAGKIITLDLNGKTVSGSANKGEDSLLFVENTAELTVKDSGENGKLTIAPGTSNVGYVVDLEGNLILESGTIEMTGSWSIGFAVDVRPNSWGREYTEGTVFTMKGGKIVSGDGAVRVTSSSASGHENVSAEFKMTGGEIDAVYDGVFIQHTGEGTITGGHDLSVSLEGGKISSSYAPIRIYGSEVINPIDLTITGGTFEYTGEKNASGWLVEGFLKGNEAIVSEAEIAISGGTFDGNVSDYCTNGFAATPDENGKYVVSEKAELFDIYASNINFGNSLAMKFAILKSDITGTDYYAEIKHDTNAGEKVTKIPFENWAEDGNFYVITYSGITAKQIGDDVNIAICNKDGSQASNIHEDGVKKYALKLMGMIYGENGPAEKDEKKMIALADMLNYGAAAQKQFDYREDRLATDGVDEKYLAYATEEMPELTNIIEYNKEQYVASTLSLKDNILYKAAFKGVKDGMYAVVSFVNHKEKEITETILYSEMEQNNGFSVITVDSLVIADAKQIITITIYNSDGTVYTILKDSMNSFFARATDDESRAIEMSAKFTASAYNTLH